MNEFIEQFLLESRELVEQATSDLLALEENPADSERLDSAFRAFHTLKGAAGIVDFFAMGRALHAAEDVLSRVRADAELVTPALISNSLTCLDQVVQWLDAMEASGEPPTNADAASDAIVARFDAAAVLPAPRTVAAYRVDHLLAGRGDVVARARTVVRYAPDSDCFFRGEDPVSQMEGLPGLLTLDLSPNQPWSALNDIDPFACNLVLAALSSEPPEIVAAFFTALSGQVDIRPLSQVLVDAGGSELSADAQLLLRAQIMLLAEPAEDGAAGRQASASRVAANVLRHAGRANQAERIEQLAASGADRLSDAITAALSGQAIEADEIQPNAPSAPAIARVLRVDVERIDTLVKLAGELTVAKNAIGHSAGLLADGADPKALAAALKDQHALLERLVNELQQSVLSVRVLPLGHVFQRFPRLVREMAAGVGKSVRFVTEGDTTEADKAVVEALFEPLLHMVRNAVDHGVEPEPARIAAGKVPVATISLRGSRNGEHVLVEVEDDGAGINVANVRRVAAERGVASAEALAALTDDEAAELIFAPGFSTSPTVTDLSGRGVGMDAVRTAVGRMGGRVSLESRPGLGAKVRLTLPFTMMMTRLMTVEAGGQVFGIPLDAVVETVRVPRDQMASIGAARAFVIRDRTVPVIDLAEALGEQLAARTSVDANIVVVALSGQIGSLEVDRLGDRIDVMLKPMDGLLSGMPGVAGTTLMGDGRVLIVLDLQELLQ